MNKVTREVAAQLAWARTKNASSETIIRAGKEKQIKNFSLELILIFLYEYITKLINKITPIINIWLARNPKKPKGFKLILLREALFMVWSIVSQPFW